MINDKLIRLGDTSFILENQVNFYINLIYELYEMEKQCNKIDLEKIFDNLNKTKVISYKRNNLFKSRQSLMIKQLKLFKLLEKDNSGNFFCSKLLIKYMQISNEQLKKFHRSTLISFEEIFFSLLILLNDKKILKIWKYSLSFFVEKK